MRDQIAVTVLGIDYHPEPCGIGPYTTGLCRGLAKRGYRVNVVTGMPYYPEWRVSADYRGKWTAVERMDDVSLKRVRHSVPTRSSNSRRLLMELTFGIRGTGSRWHEPDVVICVTPALMATAAHFLRHRSSLRQRPVFGVWVQDLYSVGLSETQKSGSVAAGLAGKLESWVMRGADGIVVPHSRFRDHLVQNLNVDGRKITTIKNWNHVQSAGTNDRRVSRRRLGWSDDETVVLHSGNMGVKQGLETVVHAAQIADSKKLNLRFVLMGDGNQRCKLESMALGVTRLEFRDPLPEGDFAAALKAADILLVNERPGVAEMSVPSKLTSYFQSGTPVLASVSSEGNAAQEVRDSNAGILIDSGDPEGLVRSAVSLGSDLLLGKMLGENGIQYASAKLGEAPAIEMFDHWIKCMLTDQKVLTAGGQR